MLAGAAGLFAAWARMRAANPLTTTGGGAPPRPAAAAAGGDEVDFLAAAYGASFLTRQCNAAAFREHGRAATTPDMIAAIGKVFGSSFEPAGSPSSVGATTVADDGEPGSCL